MTLLGCRIPAFGPTDDRSVSRPAEHVTYCKKGRQTTGSGCGRLARVPFVERPQQCVSVSPVLRSGDLGPDEQRTFIAWTHGAFTVDHHSGGCGAQGLAPMIALAVE